MSRWPLWTLLWAAFPVEQKAADEEEESVPVIRWAIPREYSQRPHLSPPVRVRGLLTRSPAPVEISGLYPFDPSEVENQDWCGEDNEDDPWLDIDQPALFPPRF